MAKPPSGQSAADDVVSRARKKVQRAIEEAERERRNTMLKRRIELATGGVRAYEKGKVAEAVQGFQGYLKILEDWKGVGQGGLTPSLFDPKKDVYELLLISAVYWDLAKIYDRTKGEASRRLFNQYMEKYVIFSKGTAFQPLCSETLRKYIQNEKPIHRMEFKNAYKILGGEKCFIASSLVDVIAPETMPALRSFRDEVLLRHWYGRAFVSVYYSVGPKLADLLDRAPLHWRKSCGRALDRFASGR